MSNTKTELFFYNLYVVGARGPVCMILQKVYITGCPKRRLDFTMPLPLFTFSQIQQELRVHFRRQFTKPFSKWCVKVTEFFSRFQAALSLMTAAQPHDPSNIFFISKRKKVLRKKLVVYKMTSLMQEQCNEFFFVCILGQQPKVQEIKELYQVSIGNIEKM